MAEYYAMRHKVTGKIYIGCSSNACFRISDHMHRLKRGKHSNKALQTDCDKFGTLFDFFLLEQSDYRDRAEREKEWQAMYRTNDPAYGYNTSVAERQRPLEKYPKIVQGKKGFELTERESDRYYNRIKAACEARGRDVEEVRKKCGIGYVEIRNLIDVDGYFSSKHFALEKELGASWDELTSYRRKNSRRGGVA